MKAEREILAEGILCRDDKVLLVQESYPPQWWNLPGGEVEPGEKAFDAIVREYREELGADIIPQRLVGIRDRGDQLVFIFEVGVAEDISLHPDGEEIIGVQWVGESVLSSDLNISDLTRHALRAWYGDHSLADAITKVNDRRGVGAYIYRYL